MRLETIDNLSTGHEKDLVFYAYFSHTLRLYLPELDKQIKDLERAIEEAELQQKIIAQTDSPEARRILDRIRDKNREMIHDIQHGVINAISLNAQHSVRFPDIYSPYGQ